MEKGFLYTWPFERRVRRIVDSMDGRLEFGELRKHSALVTLRLPCGQSYKRLPQIIGYALSRNTVCHKVE